MILQDFAVGTDITLEVVYREKSFEIPTKIVGIDPMGILIPTFAFAGRTLDFSTKDFSGILFNIYGVDRTSGSRYCWKTVSICIKNIQGVDYYLLSSSGFGKIGKECDRRTNQRISLNISGAAVVPDAKAPIEITILNVSNAGVAFWSAGNLAEIGSHIKVYFEDNVGERQFKVSIELKCVRKMPYENGLFYGCRTTMQSKEWLTYVFLKQLRQQANQTRN